MEHKTRTKALSWLLTLAMLLSLIPAMSLTAFAAGINYLDASGATATCNGYTTVTGSSTTWNEGWYVVDSNVTISGTVTLDGSANLILCDGAKLTVTGGGGNAGISGTGSLTVYGQSGGTGALTVSGGDFGNSAANPGGVGVNATMTVNGGTVTVKGGTGGGANTYCGRGGNGVSGALTVNGGTVTVNGGKGGESYGYAGHGGHGVSGTLTVNGGTVTVNGGNGGYNQYDGCRGGHGVSGTLTVNGGMVTLIGGGGDNGPAVQGNPNGQGVTGTVTAADGVVAKESDDGSAWTTVSGTSSEKRYVKVEPAPDPVSYMKWDDTKKELVEQTGEDACKDYTVVTANTTTFENGKWYVVNTPGDGVTISNPITVNGTANLILCDGAKLTAQKGITVESGNTLNIYEGWTGTRAETPTVGELVAKGGFSSAGIGGGDGQTGGSVTIHGGTVTAIGYSGGENYYSGAGIGGGGCYESDNECNGGTVAIYGGTVIATGGGNGAVGIGQGETGSNNGTLTLGEGMYLYGGTSAEPEKDASNHVALKDGDYARSQYMTVNNVVPHTHSLTDYTVSADTITAVCTAEDCPLPEVGGKHTATLTIGAPATGGGAATLTGASDFGVTAADIKYYTKSGSEWTGETSTPPSGTGFYKASVTVGGVTASVTYGVNAISKDAAFVAADAHGDFTVPAVAAVGAAIEIATTPDAGYVLDKLTVTKAGGGTVTATKDGNTGSFTMPDEEVTVSASFTGRDVGVALTVSGNDDTPCAAELLTKDFAPVGESFTSRVGEKFVLSATTDEEYDYTVKFNGKDSTASLTKFSDDDNKAYAEYLKSSGLTVPAQTELFWVTMPAVDEGDLSIAVTFGKVDSFTALYQPQTTVADTDTVWCKFTDSESRVYAAEMMKGLNMNGTTVWSVSLKSAFDPSKIAFVTVSKDADNETLKAAVDNAALTACTAQTSAAWKDISGGKYMLIGGNAKAVAAAFADGDDAQIEIGVCPTDAQGNITGEGTVKAPAASEKAGSAFGGWRGVQYDANGKASEKIYAAGDEVPVRGNTTLSAVWTPKVPKIDLDANGGEGGSNVTEVPYGEKLTIAENPTKNGYAFADWIVKKSVTEGGKFFSEGVPFDFDTIITDDLDLTALWEHVHAYTCVPLDYSGFGGALEAYYGYLPYIHVRFCGCADVKLEAHTFQDGVCTGCGYTKPDAENVQLSVSYWKDGATSAWLNDLPQTVKRNEEVTVDAFDQIGHYEFSKWQYSTDNGATWNDLAAATMVGFIIPCSLQVRAIYVSTITEPQIELSARNYVTQEQGYNWDTVLFQMNYKLPDGYTFVDAGVRMGDNDGISYYEMKEYKQSTGEKAAEVGFSFGFNMIPFVGGGLNGFLTDQTMNLISDDGPQYYYDSRENSVLDEYTAATLSKYMFENKPVNVEKYPPIYWEAKAQTKSQTGSVNTLTPLRFIQKNNGAHYIYGMAWMTYKTPDGVTKSICTEAIPVTRDNIPTYTVRATPNGMTH